MLSILRLRNFRLLWSAHLLSLLGSEISRIALFLYLFRERDSVAELALLVVCKSLPGALAAPWAGVLVDRYGKRGLMIAADLARVLFLLVIVAHPTVVVVYLMAACDSLASALFHPARAAALPALVGRPHLAQANGVDRSTGNAVIVLGPMVGALLFVHWGLAAALLLDAATFLASALLLFGLPRLAAAAAETAAAGESRPVDLAGGWRYLARRPLVRQVTVLFMVSMVCCGLWIPLAPFFIRDFLAAPDSLLGLQLAAFGLGGVVGGFLAARLASRIDRGVLLTIALLAEGVHMVVYSQVAVPAASCLVLVSWGAIFAIITVASQSLLQMEVEEGVLGRVFAIVHQGENLAVLAAMLLASLLAGSLASSSIFLAAGLVYLATVAVLSVTAGGKALLAYR